MSELRLINKFSADEEFSYDKRIKLLRERKVAQTEEKARNGGANEDDYGLIVQDEFQYKLKSNHPNGSIYGYKAWTENYCAILDSHPLYCDPLDAFVGKGFLFLERLFKVVIFCTEFSVLRLRSLTGVFNSAVFFQHCLNFPFNHGRFFAKRLDFRHEFFCLFQKEV